MKWERRHSPIKYWKVQHLINKKCLGGFAFNRRHFHTNIDACIMCICWSNEDSESSQLIVEGFDIDDEGLSSPIQLIDTQISSLYSKAYADRSTYKDDSFDGITLGLDGRESTNKARIKPLYNANLLGYMIAGSSGFDKPDLESSLMVAGCYRGNGFFLRKNNYLEKLPMFCASRYITYNREWTERARVMKSGDGATHFNADVASGKLDRWLRKCLLFTCLEMQNHMRTFKGSDGRFYRNELCLDTTNGDTLASKDISVLKTDDDEKKLLDQWNILLEYAKKTEEYNPALTYGVYQIYAEIDVPYKDETTGEIVWKNLEVHSALKTLKELVKVYYNKEIVPTLFEYEFLK